MWVMGEQLHLEVMFVFEFSRIEVDFWSKQNRINFFNRSPVLKSAFPATCNLT